jgi:hypothetical protein
MAKITLLGREAAKKKFLQLDAQISRLQILAMQFAEKSIWPDPLPLDQKLRTELLDTANKAITQAAGKVFSLTAMVSDKRPASVDEAYVVAASRIRRMKQALEDIVETKVPKVVEGGPVDMSPDAKCFCAGLGKCVCLATDALRQEEPSGPASCDPQLALPLVE